ncbi:MAG TPA: hypothetical protein PK198_05470, partial [Saprospiraceae bacterium]|nr:hypothetical protein [Saprospiraceae bacterium]
MKTAMLLSIFLGLTITACAPAAPDAQNETPPAPEQEADTPPPDWPMKDGRYVLNWPDLAIPDYRTEFNEEIGQEVSIPL